MGRGRLSDRGVLTRAMPVFSGNGDDDNDPDDTDDDTDAVDAPLPKPWEAATPRDPHEEHAIEWLPAYRDIDIVGQELSGPEVVVYDPHLDADNRWVKTDRYYDLRDCK